MPTDLANPFVGPRPLEFGDGIYGRDEEIRELLWLFTAERIVWLHSPSGAGKTSIVQAGLIPKLKADDFEVLPTIRVNRETNTGGNRYEASVLSCLGAVSDLEDFLAKGAVLKSRVLIFDQFEEILTLDTLDVEAKKAFFETIGRVLQPPDIWALFIVREDFLPALDPYVRVIPTLMNHRFRLDLFTIELAREAMEQIASYGRRHFSPEASRILGPELAMVLIPSASGQEWKPGRVVEPVILQVVCRTMWEEMPPHDKTIEPRHIPTGDKVAKSLAAYYANCVKSVSETLEQERSLRVWVGEKLIASGLRNQVLDAAGNGAGMGVSVMSALVQTHLIRREDRDDRIWYELAHDRLIEPIRTDNERWAQDNLHWVQRRADLWRLQDRPKAILLVDAELKNAEQWILGNRPQFTAVESGFIWESRQEQKVRNKIRRRTRLAWIAAGVATTLLLTATLLYIRETSRELITLARSEARGNQLGCAVQDGLEALARAKFASLDLYQSGIEALSEALQGGSAAYEVNGKDLKLAISRAKHFLAVASGNEVSLFRVPAPEIQHRWTMDPGCEVIRASLSPDSKRIAFGLSDGTVVNLNLGSAEMVRCNPNSRTSAVEALAFSRTGALASASSRGIWIDGRLISTVDTVGLAFDPDGGRLAAGLRDGTVRVLDLSGKELATYMYGEPVTGVAWGPGALAAVSRYDGAVRVWDEHGRVMRAEDHSHSPGTAAVAVSPDGSLIATAGLGEDHQTKVWQVGKSARPLILRTAPVHEAALNDLTFLDDTHLMTADSSGAVRLFPLKAKDLKERAIDFLRNHLCERTR